MTRWLAILLLVWTPLAGASGRGACAERVAQAHACCKVMNEVSTPRSCCHSSRDVKPEKTRVCQCHADSKPRKTEPAAPTPVSGMGELALALLPSGVGLVLGPAAREACPWTPSLVVGSRTSGRAFLCVWLT